ncbi:MAG: hypothetical protein AAF639_37015 [Chloroflexota bacterium]
MSLLIQYVAQYSAYIYAICGAIALWQVYRTWRVRGERRQAVFTLEREKAIRDLYNIFMIALLLLFCMGMTYFTSTTLATAVGPLVTEAQVPMPENDVILIPTDTPLAIVTSAPTSTPTPQPEQEIEIASNEAEETTNEVVIAPTVAPIQNVAPPPAPVPPTPTFTPPPPPPPPPTPTFIPTAVPIVSAPICPDQRAIFIRPGNNETVSGVIDILGTATHEQFQYYKIEFAVGQDAQNNFGYIAGGNSPISNGFLTSIDTNTLGNGTWTLQLLVVDLTGNFPPPCKVTIHVQN